MSKYFKIDRNSREIIIDKHKSYNVNIDILDLIIDLQLERDKYKNIINELEKLFKKEYERYSNDTDNLVFSNVEVHIFNRIIKKLKELKEGK